MRCLSQHANYSIQAFEGVEQIVQDARGYGQSVVLKKPVVCDFQQMGLTEWEEEAALELMAFAGLAEGVNPLTRVSCFDTEAYCERFPEKAVGDQPGRTEMNIQLDKRLIELQDRHPNEFLIVDKPGAVIPWPSYETDSVEDILKFQERLQVSPELVRLYESEMRKPRVTIIEAMLAQEEAAAGIVRPVEEPIVQA